MNKGSEHVLYDKAEKTWLDSMTKRLQRAIITIPWKIFFTSGCPKSDS